jgi:hypothetical protein
MISHIHPQFTQTIRVAGASAATDLAAFARSPWNYIRVETLDATAFNAHFRFDGTAAEAVVSISTTSVVSGIVVSVQAGNPAEILFEKYDNIPISVHITTGETAFITFGLVKTEGTQVAPLHSARNAAGG